MPFQHAVLRLRGTACVVTRRMEVTFVIVKGSRDARRVPKRCMQQDETRTYSSDGLPARFRKWLDWEQHSNERLIHDLFLPERHHQVTVKPSLRPESGAVWKQEMVLLPAARTRTYGPLGPELEAAFGFHAPSGTVPLFLHAQPTGAHRSLARQFGKKQCLDLLSAPTASYRSVLTWSPTHPTRVPSILKLSIGAIIGGRRRAFRERQIARALLVNALFDSIPRSARQRIGFDWFRETAAAVDTASGRGWLLRRWPESLVESKRSTLLPAFSLITPRGGKAPLIVDWIRNSKEAPEEFVVRHLLAPYVRVLAYLLFDQGLQYEGHTQNVLLEVRPNEQFTGRLILRDFADTTVNVAFRIARRRPLPTFPPGFLPRGTDFPFAGNACDYRCDFDTPRIVRGFDTVERYGLHGFVWPINTAIARHFARFDHQRVEQRYLELWQEAAIEHLRLRPLFRRQPRGIATDEVFSHFLQQTDWASLGAQRASLPETAEPLLIEGKMRRGQGRVYERVESPWGDLFIYNGLPGFFRPAF